MLRFARSHFYFYFYIIKNLFRILKDPLLPYQIAAWSFLLALIFDYSIISFICLIWSIYLFGYIKNNREYMNAAMHLCVLKRILHFYKKWAHSRICLVIYCTQTWSSWCSFLVSFLLRCSNLCMNINVEATNRVNGLLSITCMLEV